MTLLFRALTASALVAASLAMAAPASAIGVSSHDLAKLPAGDYRLDKSHASLIARVTHMGFSHYAIRFNKLDASFTYDPATPAAAKLTVAVDPTGLDTGAPAFDKQLNEQGWFNTATFPTISFVSTDIKPGLEGKGSVTGDLTWLGVTKPVTLDVVWNGVGSGMLPGGTRTGFSATGHIKRSDFGNKAYIPIVSDDVDLEIEVEFSRK